MARVVLLKYQHKNEQQKMKKIFLLAIAALASSALIAQDKQDKKENDTLKIKWGSSKKVWIFQDQELAKKDSARKSKGDKKEFTHWAGVDIGVSMLTTVDNKIKLPQESDTTQLNSFLDLNYGKSFSFSLNFWEKSIRIYKNHVILVTGLGIEWNNYNFKKNIILDPDAPYISASNTVTAPDSIKFTKNKLRTTYIKAPLLIELNSSNTNPDKSFHIAGGLEVGYKISSGTKQVYEIGGIEHKTKIKDDYHLADFKYGTLVRAGYGDYFTTYAYYGLSELFDKNSGPEVFPLTVGISISF